MKHFLVIFFLIITTFTSLQSDIKENVIKGVLIQRFSNFIDWPPNNKDKFIIGIFGNVNLITEWDELYKNQKIKNQEIQIINITKENIATFLNILDILFINSKAKSEISSITQQSSAYSILTVSDQQENQSSDVILNFFTQNNKIQFSINQSILMKSKLKVSYRLLKLAIIINPVSVKDFQ